MGVTNYNYLGGAEVNLRPGVKMMFEKLFLILLTVGIVFADLKSFDCKMRDLAMSFARKVQPFLTTAKFQEIADALNGAQESQHCNVSVKFDRHYQPQTSLRVTDSMFYVDSSKGDDSNPGTEASPFKTISKAVDASRSSGQASTIVLRRGTFYLQETLMLGSQDSGLVIQNYPNEEVWISGGKVITPIWEPYKVDPNGKNIYKAELASQGIDSMLGLRINTKRAIRARYPNADPEINGFSSTLRAKKWLPPTLPKEPDKEVNPDTPLRTSSDSFQKYQLGIGGPCQNFYPPAGYWCGNGTAGGGAFTYRVPSGMIADNQVLPNQPYKNPKGAIVQTWRPGHWASWMFEVGDYDPQNYTFVFSKGGFQGARGNDNGDEFYIENVMEELDYPNEWFFDEGTKTLYFYYNASGGTKPPDDTLYVIPSLKILINVTASQDKPTTGISISGVNFRDTAYTYMDPHGMPSGGDWALERTGALFLEGTENTLIENCIFERLDGNGIMISGYNRNATILKNEFVWIGSTAIALWGYTKGADIDGMGWDGTDGNQPRMSNILYNFAHELGIWEKQSSFYFQAKSCQNMIKGNIFFNGPRAGINFNDGFGGQSNVTENLLFNSCRESGDHGPFNSWDRQVFVTKVRDGTPQPDKDWDYITNNFMVGNYDSILAIDNDDGSNYYQTHHNFFAYGYRSGMKNDFGGHDNRHYNNIYSYVNKGFGINSQLKGHEDYFYNNVVVQTQDGDYGNPTCSGDGKTVVHDNKIYTPSGKVTECKMSLADWQAQGNDPGTTASKWPEDDDLVKMVKDLLHI